MRDAARHNSPGTSRIQASSVTAHGTVSRSAQLEDQQPAVSVSATSIDAIETAVAGLPIEVQRLTTQPGAVGFTATTVGDVSVLAGEFGFPIATCGDIAGDTLVVALQLEEGEGTWDGEEFSLDRAWLYKPGSEHSGVGRAEPGHRPPRFATVSLPHAVLPHDRARRRNPMVRDERVRALRGLVTDLLDAADRGGLADGRGHRAEREIIDVVTALESRRTVRPIDRTSAVWITQECLALAESLDLLPSSVDLAAGIGVSDRWVRAAFRKVYGVSVSSFFRARAIHGAHRELRSATPASTTVTEVATRWGFWHLGRFSATYRAYFGELPSDTLARGD
jgi:AraC-like DNA-binding protein